MKKIIEVENYTQRYGDLTAVNDISFSVDEGSIFAFLGPNGAGKSTTINTLCTILAKTEGTMKINGYDISTEKDAVRSSIGIVFQETTLDNNLTVYENLKLHCDFYKVPKNEIKERIDFALSLVDMQEWQKSGIKGLSGGMKRRIEIARGFVHFPKVLFLDEPTAGLDAQTRSNIWSFIKELQKQNNLTVFMTTHYMEEAEISDHIAIIDHGKIVADDTLQNLKKQFSMSSVKIITTVKDDLQSYLEDRSIIFEESDKQIHFRTDDTKLVLDLVSNFKSVITDFEVQKGTLNDVYLSITGKGVRI